MSSVIRPVKGTRDFYPAEMAVRVWLYQQARSVSELFGYLEYEGPILESLDLYAAKSSEELVKKQSYVFQDRGGDWVTLRPELTPSLARMVAQRQNQLAFPLRWWSFGPFWRYERPQKGRTREFFQWNIDLIGETSPQADAELISIAALFLQKVGLGPSEVRILVNNRSLMNSKLSDAGIPPEKHPDVFGLIDRIDKLPAETWNDQALQLGVNPSQIVSLTKIMSDQDLWRESEDLTQLFTALRSYGVADYVHFSPRVIRGLQYYTGTVFEAWDTSGDFRALFGGGRYDNLVADVGGKPVGGTGFAVGDMVVTLMLQSLGRIPQSTESAARVFITLFDESHLSQSLDTARDLRSAGIACTVQLSQDKLAKQFRYADRIGARIALIIGPDELKTDSISIKDLKTGEQRSVSRQDCTAAVKVMLEG